MLVLSLLLASTPPVLAIDYENFRGLTVKVNGVPLVEGSAFQYYEKGWKKGYFSSNWKPVTVEKDKAGKISVRFEGDNGRATGSLQVTPTPAGFSQHMEYKWRGDKPAMLESALGLLWAPPLAEGTLKVDGVDLGNIKRPIQRGATLEDRTFGPHASAFELKGSNCDVSVKLARTGAILFDARNDNIEWARDRELFWLGYEELEIPANGAVTLDAEWTITPKKAIPGPNLNLAGKMSPLAGAVGPDITPIPILPQPKTMTPGVGVVRLGKSFKFSFPPEFKFAEQEFEGFVWHLWQKETFVANGSFTLIDGKVEKLGLPAQGYTLDITKDKVTLRGQDMVGLKNALRTLGFLVQSHNGSLAFPVTHIKDFPSTKWRGVHLFVGPEALDFQTKFMSRVLGPLKFNASVLQCERTDWASTPGLKTDETMPREDLVRLFAQYRKQGIEPTPLIQSFGHMEWLFAYGKNLDLALNPQVPYAIDPRKPAVQKLLTRLWDEAINALKPKKIHFGLDEVDMRGMPDQPDFTTRLWKAQVPFLLNLAQKHHVKPMLWGDIMLAPSEAPDAANSRTVAEAQDRRSVLQPGTIIADWHYRDNSNPDVFKSLALWKNLGMEPIASNWYRSDNIRGQTLAAQKVGAGTLQTTWAGYTSNEENMIRSFDQFSAFVWAADYAWSGRQELPHDLPYQADEVLRRLYFSPPSATRPVPGESILVSGGSTGRKDVTIGPIKFQLFAPIQLHGATTSAAMQAPEKATIRIGKSVQEVDLALDSLAWVKEAEPIAEITITLSGGKLIKRTLDYGRHVRGQNDPRTTLLAPRRDGLSAVRIDLGGRQFVTSVTISTLGPSAGPRIHGITVH